MYEFLLVLAGFIFVLMFAIVMILHARIKHVEKMLDQCRVKIENLKYICIRTSKELKEVRKIL